MYYIYIREKVQGPFSITTLEENLNGGVWTSDLLCCKEGTDKWEPLNSLFHVKLVPPEDTLSTAERVLHRTQRFVMNAMRSNLFSKPQPTPSAPPPSMAEALDKMQAQATTAPRTSPTSPIVTPSVIVSQNRSLLKPGETFSTIRIIPKDSQKLKPEHFLLIIVCVVVAVGVFLLFFHFLGILDFSGK